MLWRSVEVYWWAGVGCIKRVKPCIMDVSGSLATQDNLYTVGHENFQVTALLNRHCNRSTEKSDYPVLRRRIKQLH